MPTTKDEYLGCMLALQARETVPTVEECIQWASSTADLQAGSLHLHPERWSQLLGPEHPCARIAHDGSAMPLLPPEERSGIRPPWSPPHTPNEALVREEMIWQAYLNGALVPIYHEDEARTKAAGLPLATAGLFCVSKNKPHPPPNGGCMLECRRQGQASVHALTRHHRLVTDFKSNGVNGQLAPVPTTMGSAKGMRPLVRFRDLTTTSDISSAYWCTKLKRYFLGMLRVQVPPGRLRDLLKKLSAVAAAFAVPTFGLKSAGPIFSTMLQAALDIVRFFSVRVYSVMDDSCCVSEGECMESRVRNSQCDTAMIVITLAFLQFPFQMEKNELTPSTLRLFGGAMLNTVSMRHSTSPAQARVFQAAWMAFKDRVQSSAIPGSDSALPPTLRELARVNGQVAAWMDLCKGIKAIAAPLIEWMAAEVRKQWKARKCAADKFEVNYEAHLTRCPPMEALAALQTLTDGKSIAALDGAPVRILPTKYAHVVDSDQRSHGFKFGKARSKPPPGSKFFQNPQTRFRAARFVSRHSVYAEPAGAVLSLLEVIITQDIRDSHIELYTDSSTCKAAVNNGGSRSAKVSAIFVETGFFAVLRARNVTVGAEHCPGLEMIANGIDKASRPDQIIVAELQLAPKVVWELQTWCGREIAVDLMATSASAIVPRFISRCYCPQAAATDAFQQDWSTWLPRSEQILYLFPPPGERSILRAVERAEAARVPLLLIIPLVCSSNAVTRALQLSDTLPFLFLPSQETLGYPDTSALTAWLRDKTGRRSISSASVWMAITLFAPTPRCGCPATPWTRPLLPSSRLRWTRSHKRRLQELGAACVTSAETLVETLGARRIPQSVDG